MTLRIKVIPRSARTELVGRLSDGTIKVKVAAPPDQGKANDELCRFLAQHYRVARAAVTILSGHTATRKLVKIETQ
jgi:uncharacterized protein (TIGR00251 family)